MAVSPSTLSPGSVVGEYRIEKLLGVGGFGVTYLATDLNLDLRVALKEYFPADFAIRGPLGEIVAAAPEHVESFDWGLSRFLDEARTLASFRHPNIVRVMRFFKANSSAYMVMEFVQGSALPDWAKPRRATGGIGQVEVATIALPLLDGLRVIHEAGFLHRDVKPGNIYMRADGSPVLLDFGAARKANGGSELTALVSPGYAPVEQYSAESQQGPWSDLYALGGVMYWLVTGRKPVDATARLGVDPQPAAADMADRAAFSAEFLGAIDWALSPNEKSRPQHVAMLVARLTGTTSTVDDSPVTITQKLAPSTQPGQFDTTRKVDGSDAANNQNEPLDEQALEAIRVELAQRIGPMASVLVKRAAKKHTSLEAVIAAVAGEIEDEQERTTFSKHTRRHLGNTQPRSQPNSDARGQTQVATALASSRFDLAVLEKAEKRLAQYLGVIARVVVKKAAMKARDESELYLLLADEIAEPTERRAFIRKAISSAGAG